MGLYDQPLIEALGRLGSNVGSAASSFMDAQEAERDRKRKEAQELFPVIQKLGAIATENQDGEAAARLAGQVPDLLKRGYGIDVPNVPLMGAPVMARGQEFIEQQGPSPTPGKKVGQMLPTPYEYDTGKRDFNNPQTLAAARKGLMLAPSVPEYQQLNPYEITIDKRTGKVIRQADPKPVTPHYVQDYSGDGRVTYVPVAPGLNVGVKPPAPPAPRYVPDYSGDGRATYVPLRLGLNVGVKPPAAKQSPADKALAAEVTKRTEAAAIVARVIGAQVGGQPRVMPGSADIEIDGLMPLSPKALRQLEDKAMLLGGRLEVLPGQAPRIVMNAGSTAAAVRDKLKDPRLAWARENGVETRVPDAPGVRREAPIPRPAAPKAPPRWTPEMDNSARKTARQMVMDENGGIIPAGLEGQRDIEDAYTLLKAQQMRDSGIQDNKPQSALERLIEIEEAKRQQRKGGTK